MRQAKLKDASASVVSVSPIEMGRSAQLAGVAVVGALLFAIAMTSAKRSPTRSADEADRPHQTVSTAPTAGELKRCRTVADPDPVCDAVWDAQRRRFFREDEIP